MKKKVTMDLQREVEKTFKAVLEKCDHIFQASGMQFDVDASSSEDEGGRPSAAAARHSPPRAPVDEQPAPSAPKKPDIETAEPAPAAETSDTSATTSEPQ